jgi:hypothetical protein
MQFIGYCILAAPVGKVSASDGPKSTEHKADRLHASGKK